VHDGEADGGPARHGAFVGVETDAHADRLGERRSGHGDQKSKSGPATPKGRKKESHTATLSGLGVSKSQSSRWQRKAALPQARQEPRNAA
jgi:hypothetical protein